MLSLNENFSCVIQPDINSLKYLCGTSNMYIYCILINKKPVCLYFYKNYYCSYNNKKTIELSGSFNTTDLPIFHLGFFTSLSQLYEIEKLDILLIENISNNNILLKKIMERHSSSYYYTSSYYFYNFAHLPFKSTEIFILN